MQIKDLPSSSSLASTDVLVKETSSGTTQKIVGSDLARSIKTLGNCLVPTDVVGSISSGSTAPVSSGGVYAQMSGLKVYHANSGSINIPANGHVDVEFAYALPSGVSTPWAILAWISNNGTYYSLPYVSSGGSVQTWVYGIVNNKLRIQSTTSWTSAIVYMVLLTF